VGVSDLRTRDDDEGDDNDDGSGLFVGEGVSDGAPFVGDSETALLGEGDRSPALRRAARAALLFLFKATTASSRGTMRR
jgi:hypothetical protein